MGLLDDAIRQHLDLKRRHGAPPSDVAKLEQEAFGPGELAEPAALPVAGAAAAHEIAPEEQQVYDAFESAEDWSGAQPVAPPPKAVAPPEPAVEREVVAPPEPAVERTRAAPVEPVAMTPVPPTFSPIPTPERAPELEPEPEPLRPGGSIPLDDVGERTFEHAPRHHEPDPQPDEEPGELDELEETPEFLQETPEHDRLWFEQKPPRDFDF